MSPSVKLRAPELSDVPWMTRLENEAEQFRLGVATGPYSEHQVKEYVLHSRNDLYVDRSLRWVIEDEEKRRLGMIDLYGFLPFHLRAEIGITVLPDFRKQGVARQALVLLEEHAFLRLGLHQLVAHTFTENEAAIRLFQQADYQCSGKLTQWMRVGTAYHDVLIFQKINPYKE